MGADGANLIIIILCIHLKFKNKCMSFDFMMWFIFSLQGKINNQKVRQQYTVYIYIYKTVYEYKKQCSYFWSLEHLLEPSRSKKAQTRISDFSSLLSVGHQHSKGHVLTSQFHWMFPSQIPHALALPNSQFKQNLCTNLNYI